MSKAPSIPRPRLKRNAPKDTNGKKLTQEKLRDTEDSLIAARTAALEAKRQAALLEQRVRQKEKQLGLVTEAKEVINNRKTGVVKSEVIDTLPPSAQKELENKEVLFKPNPGPQTDFLAASEKFVFYGGARGGGKSAALIVDPLAQVHHPRFRGLVLRRTMPELRDLMLNSQRIYPKAYPGAKWREQEKEWRFPSGAIIEFGYAESRTDVLRYQGREYTWIGIDELPQYPEDWIINDLMGSLRTSAEGLKTYFRATGNPGNIGSSWVKAMFIDAAPHNTRFIKKVELPNGAVEEATYRFIPATVYDNPHLLRDNSYLTMLASLPEYQKRQWLYGDWDVYEGAAFPEFERRKHVIKATRIPDHWPKFRAADWGYSSPACCLWFAVDPSNHDLIVYRELYVTKLTADEFAKRVLAMEAGENIRYGVLDASAWANRGEVGPSIAETMIREGCRWRPSDRSPRSRISGKIEVHRRLACYINEHGEETPRLKVFETCRDLIRTLPKLPSDPNNPEDVDTDADDHAYDALRYGVTSRPVVADIPWDLANPSKTGDFMPASDNFGY